MSSNMDIASYAMAAQTMKINQAANIAVIKANNQAEQALVDMVSQAVDNGRAISASATHGNNVDITI